MEIKEIIRRWQAGEGPGQIAFGTGLSRNTVRKYLGAAKAEGIAQEGPVPTEEQLSRLAGIGQSGPRQAERPSQDQLEPWADQIYQWIANDRLQMTRIHLRLRNYGMHSVHRVGPFPEAMQSLRETLGLRSGDPVLPFVLDHSKPPKSTATMPLVLPVSLSVWKNSRKDMPLACY